MLCVLSLSLVVHAWAISWQVLHYKTKWTMNVHESGMETDISVGLVSHTVLQLAWYRGVIPVGLVTLFRRMRSDDTPWEPEGIRDAVGRMPQSAKPGLVLEGQGWSRA